MDVVYVGGETSGAGAYKHRGRALRAVNFAAFNGSEGVVGSSDLTVVEGTVPGGFVNVNPGVAAVLGRATGQTYEMYVAKSVTQESVTVNATDASGVRSDMVIVRVLDPENGPAGDTLPADPVNGPYAFPEVIQGVGATDTVIEDTYAVHGVRNGYALLRLDIPASTATMEDSVVSFVDLRKMANPREKSFQKSNPHSGTVLDTTPAEGTTNFPVENGSFTVVVPTWATSMNAKIDIVTARAVDTTGPSNMFGNNIILVDGIQQGFSEFNIDWNGGSVRQVMGVPFDMDVTSKQGLTITIQSQVDIQGGGEKLQEDNGTNVSLQAFFQENPI